MSEKGAGPAGSLIALEGTGDLRADAAALLESLTAPGRNRAHAAHSGISHWDASSLFHELDTKQDTQTLPSAKTLLILYASDLAFRRRWEIEPALAEGYTVIAAPYVDTARAFGHAAGVSKDWLNNLFDVFPPAERSYWVPPRKTTQRVRQTGSFAQFGTRILEELSGFEADEFLAQMESWLEGRAGKRRLTPFRR